MANNNIGGWPVNYSGNFSSGSYIPYPTQKGDNLKRLDSIFRGKDRGRENVKKLDEAYTNKHKKDTNIYSTGMEIPSSTRTEKYAKYYETDDFDRNFQEWEEAKRRLDKEKIKMNEMEFERVRRQRIGMMPQYKDIEIKKSFGEFDY
jgi:hypothetical protein